MSFPEGTIFAYAARANGSWDYAGWKIGYPDGSRTKLRVRQGVDHGGTYDFDRVVKATGIEHWTRKGGYWLPDPKGASAKRPCCEPISSNERWSWWTCCDKPIKEDGLCGTHLNAKRKRTADREAWAEKQARGEAGKRIAEDAAAALHRRGYDAEVHYHIPIGSNKLGIYDGRVRIHAEDVLALLRRIEHLEGFIGFEPGDDA